MKAWVADLAKVANITVAIGDCATWGGIPATAPNPSESQGLQFLKRAPRRLPRQGLSSPRPACRSINVPGCPAHPDWITQIVVAVATGRGGDLSLDEFQRPKTFFTSFTQTGCTRNMHFAYKVSATEFGQRKGCLFYDLGCRGPMTHSPVQPHPVEPAIVQDPRRHALPGLHRAGIPVLRSRAGHGVQDPDGHGRARRTCRQGVDKTGYVKLTAAAKAASPAWAEEDIFVV